MLPQNFIKRTALKASQPLSANLYDLADLSFLYFGQEQISRHPREISITSIDPKTSLSTSVEDASGILYSTVEHFSFVVPSSWTETDSKDALFNVPMIFFTIRLVRVTRRTTTCLDLELSIVAVVANLFLTTAPALGSVSVPATLQLNPLQDIQHYNVSSLLTTPDLSSW